MSSEAPTDAAPAPAIRMLLQVQQLRLHPEADLHASWLPQDWPSRYRGAHRFGPGGQAALARWLGEHTPAVDLNFDTRRKRLLLLDGGSLRRLAIYASLAVHAPLLRHRSALQGPLRRLARRMDRDALRLVLDRLPVPAALKPESSRLEQRPQAAARLVVDRGYRLLQAIVATQGEAVLRRLQKKLPRRASELRLPVLKPQQLAQLDELMFMGIVPERLPQWDWLF